jgi:hypothetical protein
MRGVVSGATAACQPPSGFEGPEPRIGRGSFSVDAGAGNGDGYLGDLASYHPADLLSLPLVEHILFGLSEVSLDHVSILR